MGLQDLQKFLETHCQQACKPVDLVQIARGVYNKPSKGKRRVGPPPGNSLKLIVDADSCLDRLYGGYFSDWVCGGQWNRMLNFLTTLMQACHTSNIDMVVYLNGALESPRIDDWNKNQRRQKGNISHVLRHIGNKGTPPPKVWWNPPACLQSCLRMSLRQLGVPVACSVEEHHQEVMSYCRENFFHGILAQDADYTIFDPPRYFSSEHMKLTYKGSLETQEYVLDDVAKALDLHPNRFPLLATLLGTHFIQEEELREFYCRICDLGSPAEAAKMAPADVIKAVVGYIRGLDSVDDPETIGREVFKNATGNVDDKVSRFKQSIQYYLSGTQEGFIKFKPRAQAPSPVKLPGSYLSKQEAKKKSPPATNGKNAYIQGESGYGSQPVAEGDEPGTSVALEGALDKEISEQMSKDLEEKMQNMTLEKLDEYAEDTTLELDTTDVSETKAAKKPTQTKKKIERPIQSSSEVLRIACERHQQGLMNPWVYQLLAHGEIKIPVTLEEEMSRELPSAVEVYRPIRQRVYAVLFDLHKKLAEHRKTSKNADSQGQKGSEKPSVLVKEWVIPPSTSANSGVQCDAVRAVPLEWIVPGTQRLWMGQMPDDKGRRLKTFLGCLSCDVNGDDNLLVNTSYVPQPLVILCTVLRHMLLFCRNGMRILRKHELDAFLATAVSPLLHDVETMQEMKLPSINSRGVQLAALFMRGVEHAIFANDASGSPIPWHMSCPWMFFDGKLFHFKLLKAMNNNALMDICDGQMDQVIRVERMRQAILQGIINPEMIFAKPILPLMQHPFGPGNMGHHPHYQQNMNFRPAGAPHNHPGGGHGRGMGRGRGLLGKSRSPVDSRGGQLQIAGVVVGNWGANTQSHGNQNTQRSSRMSGPNAPPPQVMSVGPRRGGSRGVVSTRVMRGTNRGRYNNTSGRGAGRMQNYPQSFEQDYGQNYDDDYGQGQNYGQTYNQGYNQGMNQGYNRNYNPGQGHSQSYNQAHGYGTYDSYERPQYNRGRSRAYNRPGNQGRNQYQGQSQGRTAQKDPDFTKVTLEQRTKTQSSGIGRGCTVETQAEGTSVVSVSELIRGGDVSVTPPQTASHQSPVHQEVPHVSSSSHQTHQPVSTHPATAIGVHGAQVTHQTVTSHPGTAIGVQSHHIGPQPVAGATIMQRQHGIPGGLQATMPPQNVAMQQAARPGSMQGMGDIGQFEDPQAQAQFNAAAAAMIEMNKMASQMANMTGMTPPASGPIHMNGGMGPSDMQ